MAVDDPLIVHVLQSTGDSQDLALRMKIREMRSSVKKANQLQPIGRGVLMKIFLEAEMAGSVEEKGERVDRGWINANKPDNIWVRELSAYPDLSEVPLKWNVNHVLR